MMILHLVLATHRQPLSAAAAFLAVLISVGAGPVFAEGPSTSFREDVIPVLTKAGCNQGACHGAQFGQGGFKLSLLGFAPEEDYAAIARQSRQRRISLANPAGSLLLRKPTMAIPHEGGERLRVGSRPYETLKSWIESGAHGLVDGEPTISDIRVSPVENVYEPGQVCQLEVEATYSDGSVRNATHRARYDSLNSGIATVDDSGRVTIVGRGQTAIMVRYRGKAKVSMVVSPFAEHAEATDFAPVNFIDEYIRARWIKLGLRPSGVCSDAQFIRRAFLSSIGTLPTSRRVIQFVDSDDPDKRETLVDELLGLTGDPKRDVFVEEWSAFWAQKWGDLLRNNRKQIGEIGMWAFHNWIRNSLRENKPIDQFVREILLANGSIYQFGQANYYKVASSPADLAETTAQVFLGMRLQCARCHQHPFESVSQTDYYGLAAFFTRVDTKRSSDFGGFGGETIVRVKSSGTIAHPRTGEVMRPTTLGGQACDTDVGDLRRPLVEWVTSPDNPMLARNMANRVWGYLMGVGLVEPIDDLRATNPPSHPQLLNALARYFIDTGYDLRQLMRAIMVSRVFQLSSTATAENAADTRFYSHYLPRRLPAEVLLDAIDRACGTRERFAGVPPGTRAIELPDPNFSSYFLDTLGRPQRIIACECERSAAPNLAQVLQIVNGELIHRKLTDRQGRIAQLLQREVDDERAFKELFLAALSRRPTDAEINHCRTILQQASNRREGLEDILWAIINSREFMFNH